MVGGGVMQKKVNVTITYPGEWYRDDDEVVQEIALLVPLLLDVRVLGAETGPFMRKDVKHR
jgi:hypothetical protein